MQSFFFYNTDWTNLELTYHREIVEITDIMETINLKKTRNLERHEFTEFIEEIEEQQI